MVVLRSVRGAEDIETFVPHLGVNIAFLFVLASMVIFLFYIHHIAQSIRVATIIASIGAETRALIERRHPPESDERDTAQHLPVDGQGGPPRLVAARQQGIVVTGRRRNAGPAGRRQRQHGAAATGHREFVPAGAALFRVYGQRPPLDEQLCAGIILGEERTLDQDVGFGLRQLVDIADRALSPGVNDPTTAIQVIDQLHDLLRRLVVRPLPPLRRTTSDERLAVLVPTPDFEDYLVLAVDEIARWGSDADRVQNRLRGMLRDLYSAALPAYRAAIARQLLRWNEQPGQASEPDLTPSDVGLRPSPAWSSERGSPRLG